MAKKAQHLSRGFDVDRFLLVGTLLGATAYILHGTWTSVFFEAAALVIGIMWSYRAIMTNPSRQFRLLATLLLILLSTFLAFNLAPANGVTSLG
jgi:hypothetical protein